MALSLGPPDAGLLARTAPFVRLLAEAAEALGASLEMDREYGFVGRLVAADGQKIPIFGKSLGLNPDAAAALAADKDYTARWLSAEGLPTPSGQLVFSAAYRARMALKNADTAARLPGPDVAEGFATRQGYPVIVKPNTGSEGRDITLCANSKELTDTLCAASDEVLRVEARIPGRDYRLLVLDGRVVLAYERRPLSVIGDGETPLSDLIKQALAALANRHRGSKIAPDDPRLLRRFESVGHRPETVLPAGVVLPLLDNANLSTGGTLREVTDELPEMAATLAIRAAAALGLISAGVDILAPDLLGDPEQATVLEVNSAPGLDYFATSTPENWRRARAIVTDMLRLRLQRAG